MDLTIIFMLIFAATAIGFTSGIMQNNKTKSCTEVRAYIPVKGKWLEKNVCLEGEK
jgi:hypothetical protein